MPVDEQHITYGVPDDLTGATAHKTRRDFLRQGTLTALAVGMAACTGAAAESPAKTGRNGTVATASVDGHDTHAPTTDAPAASPKPGSREAADAMDAMHEAGIKAFPAKTAGKGNTVLAPRIEGGVKVYDLRTSVLKWEVEPGKLVEAWAYNEMVPGPQIRVREGDRVRINLENALPESTVIHFHGLELPNDQDGVPYITQPPVKPGETYTYEFTVPNAGSHMYHSHHNAAKQVALGLLGAFVVEPRVKKAHDRADVDHVMVLNDGFHGYTLNGKSFPATEPIVAKLGQTVRIRFMNEGMMIHPMHLHGMHMTVVAKDGWDQPAPWKCDTLNIAPGERWDVIVKATNPGTWAFHCHILSHAESQHGMFGMVTVLVVEK